MSFDALTIAGILSAISSGGFIIALVARNGAAHRRREDERGYGAGGSPPDSRP